MAEVEITNKFSEHKIAGFLVGMKYRLYAEYEKTKTVGNKSIFERMFSKN